MLIGLLWNENKDADPTADQIMLEIYQRKIYLEFLKLQNLGQGFSV